MFGRWTSQRPILLFLGITQTGGGWSVGAVGRCRGVQPRPNTSMMIMRPPQHAAWTGRFVAIDGLAVRFCSGEELAGATSKRANLFSFYSLFTRTTS
jgi:hypothetical protein